MHTGMTMPALALCPGAAVRETVFMSGAFHATWYVRRAIYFAITLFRKVSFCTLIGESYYTKLLWRKCTAACEAGYVLYR